MILCAQYETGNGTKDAQNQCFHVLTDHMSRGYMYLKNATHINREKQQLNRKMRSLKNRGMKNRLRTFQPENGQKFKNSEPPSKFSGS